MPDDLGVLLVELYRDLERLVEMHTRDGRLWQPGTGEPNPDVARLPLFTARIVGASMHQPEPK